MKRLHDLHDVSNVNKIVLVLEGDGNPAHDHSIVGVIFYDENDKAVKTVGDVNRLWLNYGPPEAGIHPVRIEGAHSAEAGGVKAGKLSLRGS
jgi:hypothetical protein